MASVGGDRKTGLISSPDLGDGISVADILGVERVRIGRISANDFGIKVVSSDGATVIIDGTSDIFKIAATGTVSVTIADQAAGSNSVDLTALAPQATSLALLGMIGTTVAASDARRPSYYITPSATRFVAAVSGGAVTTRAIPLSLIFYSSSSLVGAGTDTPRVLIGGQNEAGASFTGTLRYYLLLETAI